MSRILTRLKQGVDMVGAVIFLIMFGAFICQVFWRYVLNNPMQWAEEVSLIAFLWFVFWGGGLMVPEREHVRFDMLYQAVGPRVRRVMAIVGSLAMAAIYLAGLPGNFDFVTFMAHDQTWVLGIRFDVVFSVFVLFMVAYAIRHLIRLRTLAGRDWSREI